LSSLLERELGLITGIRDKVSQDTLMEKRRKIIEAAPLAKGAASIKYVRD
jgi:hypothetical protein